MSYFGSTDFLIEVMKGNIPGHSYVHKFGATNLTTTIAAISNGGVYQTPTTAAALEFVSSSANDTAAGTGAQQITIEGLDSNWNLVTQTLETNGTTAVALTTNLVRMFRFYVSRTGTYANLTAASYAGQLTIQGSGGGVLWGQIIGSGVFPAQSEIASYTVPTGFTAYLLNEDVFVDSNKSADVYFLQRPFADDVTTPFQGARRITGAFIGVSSNADKNHRGPKGPFVGPCDLGYIGQTTTGTAEVVAEFDLLIVEDGF